MSTDVNMCDPVDVGVYLTTAALDKVKSYLTEKECSYLRLSVKKTGCSGLSYVIDFTSSPLLNDVVFPLVEGYFVCIDKVSYPFLRGLKIDYVKQGIQKEFTFDNPNKTGECGCGQSFTVD